jgi:hypothetical protein
VLDGAKHDTIYYYNSYSPSWLNSLNGFSEINKTIKYTSADCQHFKKRGFIMVTHLPTVHYYGNTDRLQGKLVDSGDYSSSNFPIFNHSELAGCEVRNDREHLNFFSSYIVISELELQW